MTKLFIFATILVLHSTQSNAMSLIGRLGIGATNQVVTGLDALSVKLQRNRSIAMSGIFGINNSEDSSQYALGAKVFRLIYDEPQVNFYSSLSAITFTFLDDDAKTTNGYQVDAGFGAEFSLQGLESIGFSFEFGMGLHKYKDGSSIRTYGHNILTSAVHFYL
jgi:hypothetical protein